VAFLAVTVVGPASTADLSVPAGVPLAELLPDLARLVAGDPEEPPDGTGWGLSRLGEGPLGLDASLAAAGVREGDTLYLRPRTGTRPAVVVDLADAVADAVDVRGGMWTADVRRVTLTLAAAAALMLATAVAAVELSLEARAGIALGVALLAGLGAVIAFERTAATASTLLALSGLMPWGVAGGSAGALLDPGSSGAVTAGAATGVAVGAATAALAVPTARGPAAAAALAVVPAGIVAAAGSALGASPGQMAAVLAVWGVCLAAQLPVVVATLHLGDALAEVEGGLTVDEVTARVDAVHPLLAWLSAGTAVGLTGALAVLALSTRPWELALGSTACLAAALGSRRQRFLGQGLPPLVAALAGGLLLELSVAAHAGDGEGTALAIALLLGSFALLLGLVTGGGRRGPSALMRRQLRRLESLSLVALLPLGLGALGVYSAIGDLGRRLGT
jgi:ESX secretion system protein EccD